MGTGRLLWTTLAVLALGGPLEAAGGGRLVRAAVRLQTTIEAKVPDPGRRALLAGVTGTLIDDLRAARQGQRAARRAAYLTALDRARLIDAALATEEAGPARVRLLHAVAALERALAHATRVPGHGWAAPTR